jgi:hypothetical protein
VAWIDFRSQEERSDAYQVILSFSDNRARSEAAKYFMAGMDL